MFLFQPLTLNSLAPLDRWWLLSHPSAPENFKTTCNVPRPHGGKSTVKSLRTLRVMEMVDVAISTIMEKSFDITMFSIAHLSEHKIVFPFKSHTWAIMCIHDHHNSLSSMRLGHTVSSNHKQKQQQENSPDVIATRNIHLYNIYIYIYIP